jgi:hypothetical protein
MDTEVLQQELLKNLQKLKVGGKIPAVKKAKIMEIVEAVHKIMTEKGIGNWTKKIQKILEIVVDIMGVETPPEDIYKFVSVIFQKPEEKAELKMTGGSVDEYELALGDGIEDVERSIDWLCWLYSHEFSEAKYGTFKEYLTKMEASYDKVKHAMPKGVTKKKLNTPAYKKLVQEHQYSTKKYKDFTNYLRQMYRMYKKATKVGKESKKGKLPKQLHEWRAFLDVHPFSVAKYGSFKEYLKEMSKLYKK